MQKPQACVVTGAEGLSQISMTEVNTRLRIVYISTGPDAERFDAVRGWFMQRMGGGWWRVGCWETDETKVFFFGLGVFWDMSNLDQFGKFPSCCRTWVPEKYMLVTLVFDGLVDFNPTSFNNVHWQSNMRWRNGNICFPIRWIPNLLTAIVPHSLLSNSGSIDLFVFAWSIYLFLTANILLRSHESSSIVGHFADG